MAMCMPALDSSCGSHWFVDLSAHDSVSPSYHKGSLDENAVEFTRLVGGLVRLLSQIQERISKEQQLLASERAEVHRQRSSVDAADTLLARAEGADVHVARQDATGSPMHSPLAPPPTPELVKGTWSLLGDTSFTDLSPTPVEAATGSRCGMSRASQQWNASAHCGLPPCSALERPPRLPDAEQVGASIPEMDDISDVELPEAVTLDAASPMPGAAGVAPGHDVCSPVRLEAAPTPPPQHRYATPTPPPQHPEPAPPPQHPEATPTPPHQLPEVNSTPPRRSSEAPSEVTLPPRDVTLRQMDVTPTPPPGYAGVLSAASPRFKKGSQRDPEASNTRESHIPFDVVRACSQQGFYRNERASGRATPSKPACDTAASRSTTPIKRRRPLGSVGVQQNGGETRVPLSLLQMCSFQRQAGPSSRPPTASEIVGNSPRPDAAPAAESSHTQMSAPVP